MSFKINNQKAINKLPEAIIFDLDNTLYNYEPCHKAGLGAVCIKASAELNITEQQFYEGYKKAQKIVKGKMGKVAASHSRLLYFQAMMENIGLGSQALLSLDFEQTYWRVFLNEAEIFQGVFELLDSLRIYGVKTIILTDLTSQIQFKKLVFWGLDKYFENIVTSEEVGIDKPAKEMFDLAISKLGKPSGDIWMVGDNPEKDIKGAQDAINAITLLKVSGDNNKGEIKADIEFDDFYKLQDFIESLAKR